MKHQKGNKLSVPCLCLQILKIKNLKKSLWSTLWFLSHNFFTLLCTFYQFVNPTSLNDFFVNLFPHKFMILYSCIFHFCNESALFMSVKIYKSLACLYFQIVSYKNISIFLHWLIDSNQCRQYKLYPPLCLQILKLCNICPTLMLSLQLLILCKRNLL